MPSRLIGPRIVLAARDKVNVMTICSHHGSRATLIRSCISTAEASVSFALASEAVFFFFFFRPRGRLGVQKRSSAINQ